MLNILERFDLKADGPRSPRTLHRVTEAMRRGFFTRATAIADPDFVDVPVDELTSKPYADELARDDRRPGHPERLAGPVPDPRPPRGTTRPTSRRSTPAGNAVALTYTLEEGYGSQGRGRRRRASCSTTRWATST